MSAPVFMEFLWLPWRLPVPDGWHVVEGQQFSHHHRYRRLIARTVTE